MVRSTRWPVPVAKCQASWQVQRCHLSGVLDGRPAVRSVDLMRRKSSVARTRNGVVILQRRGAPAVGIAGIVAIGSMAAIGLPLGFGKNSLMEMLLLVSFVLAGMRIVWRAMVRPRIEVREEFLTIYGFFDRHVLPVPAIDGVDSSDGLEIVVAGGDSIPVFAFSGSFLDCGRTVEAAAREVKRLVSPSPGDADEVRRITIDWTWVDLVFIPFVVLLVVSVAMEG